MKPTCLCTDLINCNLTLYVYHVCYMYLIFDELDISKIIFKWTIGLPWKINKHKNIQILFNISVPENRNAKKDFGGLNYIKLVMLL